MEEDSYRNLKSPVLSKPDIQKELEALKQAADEYYIANLQKTTGVLDDQLRPAFQQLLTVTGSVTQSQAALDTALNVSAATGKSLTEVTAALSKGFAGNATALTRLGVGLDKATLKSGKMDDILKQLNQKFAGQAAARLETYAGKMDLINVAAANAKENIGKGLLDALTILSKDKSIENLADDFETLSLGIAGAITDIAKLIDKIKQIPGLDLVVDPSNIPVIGAYLDYLMARGSQMPTPSSNFTYSLGPSATKDNERARLILEANKARSKENKLIKEIS